MIRTLLLAAVALTVAISLARWFEEGDYYEPVRGRRHCAAAPAAITSWASTGRARQAADGAGLDEWLQQHANDVNRLFGAFWRSPLHTAARFGREDLAALLIARGADLHARSEPQGQTPLHPAAQHGHAGVAALLVSRGAAVDAPTKFGRTPLHDAAFGLAGTSDIKGRLDVATLLLARGANVNACEQGSGRTPLDQALTSTGSRVSADEMTALLVAAGGVSQTAPSR